jgi:hypothetical protein
MRSALRSLFAFMAVMGMLFGSISLASAASVVPVQMDGNPHCIDLKLGENTSKDDGKVDPPVSGENGYATFQFHSGTSVDWQAKSGYAMVAVIVKGGNEDANVYYYDPAATSDSGLQTPTGQDISHVQFCYIEVEEEEELYWCSPGFWKTRQESLGEAYNPGPYLSDTIDVTVKGVTKTVTIADALNMTGQYSNPAANYLSAIFFGADAGTDTTEGAFCPIDAHGNWVGMQD